MGAFGIFIAILTFIYIVYYAVMIGLDVMGDKGKKKNSVEVIAVGDAGQESYVEQPTYVKENEEEPSSKEEGAPSTEGEGSQSLTEEDGAAMAAAILAEDEGKLYAAAQAAEKEMTKVVAESKDELTEEEYDNVRLAQLVAESEENAENMSI